MRSHFIELHIVIFLRHFLLQIKLVLHFAYVMLSELYLLCSKKGFQVRSFGSGTHVKLPGPSPQHPNIYDFNTTYDEMYRDLAMKDKQLYPLSRVARFTTTASREG